MANGRLPHRRPIVVRFDSGIRTYLRITVSTFAIKDSINDECVVGEELVSHNGASRNGRQIVIICIANPRPSTFGFAGSMNLEGELLSSAIANSGISTFGLAGRVKALSEPPGLHLATKINAALLDSVNCYGLTYFITLRQSMLFQHRYTVLACGSQDAQTNSPSECYVHVL
jgi:hypothetical protein